MLRLAPRSSRLASASKPSPLSMPLIMESRACPRAGWRSSERGSLRAGRPTPTKLMLRRSRSLSRLLCPSTPQPASRMLSRLPRRVPHAQRAPSFPRWTQNEPLWGMRRLTHPTWYASTLTRANTDAATLSRTRARTHAQTDSQTDRQKRADRPSDTPQTDQAGRQAGIKHAHTSIRAHRQTDDKQAHRYARAPSSTFYRYRYRCRPTQMM
jgi:hypothetical protein